MRNWLNLHKNSQLLPERKVYIEEISQEVTLRRNTRIRRLSIKIGVDSGVVVCVPKGVSNTVALQFVIQQQNWVKQHLSSDKYQKQAIPDEIQLVSSKISLQEIEHNVPLIKEEKEDIIVKIPETLFSKKKSV